MKYTAPFALALMLGACAHVCDCEPVEAATFETTEVVETEEVVEVEEVTEPEEVVEVEVEETIVEVESVAPTETVVEVEETTVVGTAGSTGKRVVTRRLVESHDAGTPTAPAMEGNAADDALLSETPHVIEEQVFETTGTETTVTTVVDEIVEEVEETSEEVAEEVEETIEEFTDEVEETTEGE